MQRFIGKKISKKYVRPICNSAKPHKVKPIEEKEKINIKKEEVVMNDKIEKIENVLETQKLPKRKVKIEKKDKGLLERTDNSTILLTEDNKILLTD